MVGLNLDVTGARISHAEDRSDLRQGLGKMPFEVRKLREVEAAAEGARGEGAAFGVAAPAGDPGTGPGPELHEAAEVSAHQADGLAQARCLVVLAADVVGPAQDLGGAADEGERSKPKTSRAPSR